MWLHRNHPSNYETPSIFCRWVFSTYFSSCHHPRKKVHDFSAVEGSCCQILKDLKGWYYTVLMTKYCNYVFLYQLHFQALALPPST